MLVWLIGLSGAGKTTIGSLLVEKLRSNGRKVVFLDGDILREVWGDQPGHDVAGRRKNGERIMRLSHTLATQGIDVVASVLSLFPEHQSENRRKVQDYFEVYIDVPLSILKERDTKGLYAAAESGKMPNVVGIDIPWAPPPYPDLVLGLDWASRPPAKSVEKIFDSLQPLLKESAL